MPPLNLQLTRGLALFDCQDHYAILGIPLTADSKVIRKRYLKVARQLHPDSIGVGVDKGVASTILSKLVNPSYEFLSSSNQLEEYKILLKLVTQRYAQDATRYPLASQEAQQLLKAQDVEKNYQDLYQLVAGGQFDTLGKYANVTDTLSEINLAYLYRQDSSAAALSASKARPSNPLAPPQPQQKSPDTARRSQTPIAQPPSISRSQPPVTKTPSVERVSSRNSNAPETSSRNINYDLVDQYCRRAEELIDKACYLEAVRELKEVVEGNNPIDPNNSKVYTLLGDIYKEHMKQPVMAKPFYMKALKSEPDNADIKGKLASIAPSASKQAKAKSAQARGKSSDSGAEKKKFGFLNFLSRKK